MTKMTISPIGESDYNELLLQAVAEIENARQTLARQVASTVSGVHWSLGKLLSERKIESKHGSGIVNRLSSDLKSQYPDMGLSPRNLWNMKRFYERYKDEDPKLLQAVAVLPWGHNLLFLDKAWTLVKWHSMRRRSSAKAGPVRCFFMPLRGTIMVV